MDRKRARRGDDRWVYLTDRLSSVLTQRFYSAIRPRQVGLDSHRCWSFTMTRGSVPLLRHYVEGYRFDLAETLEKALPLFENRYLAGGCRRSGIGRERPVARRVALSRLTSSRAGDYLPIPQVSPVGASPRSGRLSGKADFARRSHLGARDGSMAFPRRFYWWTTIPISFACSGGSWRQPVRRRKFWRRRARSKDSR